ncbi:ShlB/FhaC/HecB family hemolysin secretion/activation protein, partial [Phenylobacterium sp.]|uniref:ShlB/FhaC/HecB family hemolysin secretion/activation protein n=1 Tax=Phenylobacterium sp. TaxID=1871053 RepID=UPI002EDA6900
YAQPAPALVPPPPAARPSAAAPAGAPVTDVRITVSGPHRPAVPPEGWRPPSEQGAALMLEHQAGQPLDEAWVRAQFTRHGVRGAGVGRALAVVQLVNRAFLSAGFINSGVVVRASPAPGVLALEIVYGGLASPAADVPPVVVEWVGGKAKGLDAAYVIDRMPSARRRPLSAVELERDFRLLAEDPGIRTINADLRPGARAGEASLGLAVLPQDRFDLYVTVANNRSPSVGGERLAVGGQVRNLVGPGDRLSLEGGLTDGVEDATVAYAFPFVSPRTTVSVRGSYNDAAVIDEQLAPLDIRARDRAFEAGFTRKLVDVPLLPSAEPGRWTPARTLSAGMLFAWRRSTAYLLGERFSFAPGAVDGRTEYRAVRFVGDYVVRNVDQVFAVSVTGTRGLDGTKSDVPGLPVPEMDFHAVLAQVNYARRLTGDGLELRARAYGQWADSVLYSGERFSAGGETTVRGYRENLLLADKGIVGSVELARPFRLGGRQGAARTFDWGAFTASAFVDSAYMENHKPPQPTHRIYSVGASLAWTPAEMLSARVTYAEDLKAVEHAGERDLQDRGFSFRVTVRPLKFR